MGIQESDFEYDGMWYYNPTRDGETSCDGCDQLFSPWQHYAMYSYADRLSFRIHYHCQEAFFKKMTANSHTKSQ